MTSTPEKTPDLGAAREILRIARAFSESKVLHTAVDIDLFDTLADSGPLTEEQIRARLGLHARLTQDFLDALFAIGLLERNGDRYGNSDMAREFLTTGARHSLCGLVRNSTIQHYPAWGRLTEALRSGNPVSDGIGGRNAFAEKLSDPKLAEPFLDSMDAHNSTTADRLTECVDWSRYHRIVDAGGARGNVAATIVSAEPHLNATVFDIPALESYFTEHMKLLGTTGRVSFQAGDFFTDPFPRTDVVIFGHVLHDWAPQERQTLLQRAYPAIEPGGAVIVYDQMLDAERRDAQKILTSLNVRVMREGGSEYSTQDCARWATEAGFRVTRILELDTVRRDTVLVAEKE
ncbi:methyltransferase [Sciscionella marina]|uniref:methyltransferase n=1 Tax=Sciscionella marina TaxID=508770 RepID=UPI0004754A21|nr:methyltransferase [Sciscionella marina]